eukprot:3789739-Prymnesium_polylepis.2
MTRSRVMARAVRQGSTPRGSNPMCESIRLPMPTNDDRSRPRVLGPYSVEAGFVDKLGDCRGFRRAVKTGEL